ncbi:hypothetical protein PISMIDRAFT_681535 [Pisolithus microcarpus 441]|uniref:Uncharacterized protein n=1 Tax=Pisolithus microcarpus 441 TaxID=765257 RepID=A0A0C9Z538_9AGAM|nr:hypothetical protein PISMIDRAFT_681535 [Pisolithus microcarpus 441]
MYHGSMPEQIMVIQVRTLAIRDSGVRIVRFHISYSERVVSTRLRLSKSRRKGWVKSELSTAT